MEHYAGLDVSLELTSVCVVDARGEIVREAKVASEPEALILPASPGRGDLLTARKLIQAKLLDAECSIRGVLRGFGFKVGLISRGPLVLPMFTYVFCTPADNQGLSI